ncbi:hypothetical protein [Chitinimonas sp. BJB300]|uniref:hypothetical protein n=1 Tax=Chitinimonas sp. BJB300 TaxID=1559339 RepID=UPI000C113E34|nr:hypothetical protein [Chitinimonas sp. BJB300]PHV09887.1 hypothetical protein CSQ89_19230 [Chitinimonas sp. BJB300]TSJ83873.1 hypothetical protein FG002_020305 [Chitinimonas sp. BJB300]
MHIGINGLSAFSNGLMNGYQLGRQLKRDREADALQEDLKGTQTAKQRAEIRAQQEQYAEQQPIDQANQAASASRVAESLTTPQPATIAANGLDLGTGTDWAAEAVRLGAKDPVPGPIPTASKGLAGWQNADGSAKARVPDAKPRKATVSLEDQLAALEDRAMVFESHGKIEEAERVRDMASQRYEKEHSLRARKAFDAYQQGDTSVLANFLDNDIHDNLKYQVTRQQDGGAVVKRLRDGKLIDEQQLPADQVMYLFGQMQGPEAAAMAYGAWQSNHRANQQMDLQRKSFDFEKDIKRKALALDGARLNMATTEFNDRRQAIQKQRDLAGQYNRLSTEERAGEKGRQLYASYLALNGGLDIQSPDYKIVNFETPTPDGMGVLKTPAAVNMKNPAAGTIALTGPGGNQTAGEDPQQLAALAGRGDFAQAPTQRAASTGLPGQASNPAKPVVNATPTPAIAPKAAATTANQKPTATQLAVMTDQQLAVLKDKAGSRSDMTTYRQIHALQKQRAVEVTKGMGAELIALSRQPAY